MMIGWEHLGGEQKDRIARGIAENRVYGGPFYLELHPTNQCTVNCFACYCRECRKGESLPWAMLEGMLRGAAQRDLKFLRLSGGGESLCYPQIDPLLDLIGELGLRIVDLTTNGTLLERAAERLVGVGTDFALISLNECDPERYGRMMQVKPALFERSVAGVAALCRARDAAPAPRRPKVVVQFLVWRENYTQLCEMVRFGRALGADKVYLKAVDQVPPELRIPEDRLDEVRGMLSAMIEADCLSGRHQLLFDFRQNPELNHYCALEKQRWPAEPRAQEPDLTDFQPRIQYCYMGWVGMLVSASGLVYPCCPMYGLPHKEVGNLYEQSLEAIWTGRLEGRFRSEFQQLMRVGGDLEHSRRAMRYIEPVCIDRLGCPFGYCLCSTDFYQTTADLFAREVSSVSRCVAGVRNSLMRQAHRVTARMRGKKNF